MESLLLFIVILGFGATGFIVSTIIDEFGGVGTRIIHIIACIIISFIVATLFLLFGKSIGLQRFLIVYGIVLLGLILFVVLRWLFVTSPPKFYRDIVSHKAEEQKKQTEAKEKAAFEQIKNDANLLARSIYAKDFNQLDDTEQSTVKLQLMQNYNTSKIVESFQQSTQEQQMLNDEFAQMLEDTRTDNQKKNYTVRQRWTTDIHGNPIYDIKED